VAGGATPNFIDAASLAERVVQRGVQRLTDKPKGIEKIALAGTVLTDQEDQRPQGNRTSRNALVVLEHDSCYQY
jgi:hypothetical protein